MLKLFVRPTLFFAIVLGAASMLACGLSLPGEAASGSPTPSSPFLGNSTSCDGNVLATLPWQLTGRFTPGDKDIEAEQAVSWAGSRIQARFVNSATLTIDLQSTGPTLYDLVLDANTPLIIDPAQAGALSIAGLNPNIVHTVSLTKRTEAAYGSSVFHGFVLAPGGQFLRSLPPRARRIEMIGDSITNGYGVLGPNANCSATSANEAIGAAYGSVLGTLVNADVQTIAWAGRGVVTNVDGTTNNLMPDVWRRSNALDSSTTWDTSAYTPDAVIVNLGTNDYTRGSVDRAAFVRAYASFAAALRQAYPSALIYLTVGPMLYGSTLNEAISAVGQVVSGRMAAGDAALYSLVFPTQNVDGAGLGAGCEYHPNAATQRVMALIMATDLNKRLGW